MKGNHQFSALQAENATKKQVVFPLSRWEGAGVRVAGFARIRKMSGLLAVLTLAAAGVQAEPFLLVEAGQARVPVIVEEHASEPTLEAVRDLVAYIRKISGAHVELLTGAPDPLPEHAVWIGTHAALPDLFPEADLAFQYPEEILNLSNGQHLLIAGRDRKIGTNQVEYGTANAIYAFLEKQLDVRWLWPGDLGEDVIRRDTISLPAFEYRHHPVMLKRHFWPRNPRDWHVRQRLLNYSYPLHCGHGFTDWWEKYGETHPEYFALQPNGTRNPPRSGTDVKLCISNPEVWAQWLDNAETQLKADPTIRVLSATPNDGPWHCSCENCRAWDHPDAPQGSLTERHVKFWNILARGLKERFPDREVYVGAAAYAAYYAPPVAEKLEPNVAIAQVGHFPLTDPENRADAKRDWKKWADLATIMWYRPNLFYWAGGVWGLPEVAMQRTIEDFRFLAENKCIGIEVDVLRNVWSTQGPQYYLMAQLTYDPFQDGAAVLADYYRRGFGPAAGAIETYWTMLEEACDAIMADPEFKIGSGSRYKLPPIFERVYSEERMARIEEALRQAEAQAADSELYRKRVAYVRTGFDYTRLLVRTIPLMTRVRESQARDREAVAQAKANWDAIAELSDQAPSFALPVKNIRDSFIGGNGYQGGMQDYLGPPSDQLLALQHEERITLQPAEWTLAFSDTFDRAELDANWRVLEGRWYLKDGALQTDGDGTIICTRSFPGLQKIVFEAVATPNPGISDLSPFLQASEEGLYAGYFLRFGGNYNKESGILRQGKLMQESKRAIEPGKTHQIVAEYDGINVRLTVDGELVAEFPETRPLIGEEHDRIGFYVYEGTVRITGVQVYAAPALKVGEVLREGEGFE